MKQFLPAVGYFTIMGNVRDACPGRIREIPKRLLSEVKF